MNSREVEIGSRFNGPPGSAHGGYSAGLLGTAISGPAEVTLLAPPPLRTPLMLEVAPDRTSATLVHRDGVARTIATAGTTAVEIGPPPSIDPARVAAAMPTREVLRRYHPFPTCFGCGPDRAAGDGLCLFAGELDPHERLWGVTWRPDGSEAVDPLLVWAAMDCPSSAPAQDPTGTRPIVLGRFAVDVRRPVPAAGAEHLILSAPLEHQGRKRTNAVWLVDVAGHVLAAGRATWIELKPADASARRGDGR